MLISEAYAQAAAAPPGGDFLTTLPMIVIIFALFYFIVIRHPSEALLSLASALLHASIGDGLL